MKKVRITSHTFALSTFITPWCTRLVQDDGDTERNASKSHRGKKTETGVSDPTFFGLQPPKKFLGSLPPSTRLASALFPR